MKVWALFILVVYAAGALMLLSGSPGMRLDLSNFGWLTFLFPAAAGWLLFFGDRATASSLCRQNPRLLADINATVASDSLEFVTPHSSSHLDWSNFDGWEESTTLLVLFGGKNTVYPIPKRAFSPESLVLVRTMLAEKLGTAGTPKRATAKSWVIWVALVLLPEFSSGKSFYERPGSFSGWPRSPAEVLSSDLCHLARGIRDYLR